MIRALKLFSQDLSGAVLTACERSATHEMVKKPAVIKMTRRWTASATVDRARDENMRRWQELNRSVQIRSTRLSSLLYHPFHCSLSCVNLSLDKPEHRGRWP